MRRGARHAAAAAALPLCRGPLAAGRPSAHAATTCVKHTKRVVRHVRRHGGRERGGRFRHHSPRPRVAPPAGPTPAPGPSAPAGPVTDPPAAAPTPEPEPEANALGVAADDHGGRKSYTLSRGTVRSGRLTVQLQNKGEDPHDMDMQRVGPDGEPLGGVVEVPVTEQGDQKPEAVTVDPGHYRMWCNLFNHAKEGMEATVTVE